MSRTKIAFLYSELAGYFVACVNELSKSADVLVFRWPVNDEAPFLFEINDTIQIVEKNEGDYDELQKKLATFTPDIVVCSGWMDKEYLKLVQTLPKSCKKIIALDNHWKGSLRQRIGAFISPFYIKRIFDLAWVPGTPQAIFAKKMGFKESIIDGFYCANTPFFNRRFEKTFDQKKKQFPKRFLYAARYVKQKGIFDLWEAFKLLQNEHPNDWELWCIGTGIEFENRIEHPQIKHFGFVQPADIETIVRDTGVYVLPSIVEPWGVSTQEFAICGYPLILSSEIGASELFLGENGKSFPASDVDALKDAMLEFVKMEHTELIKMGEISHQKGMAYTTTDWVNKILGINE
jgi:glycosyltransferase involved in cell wall biosynthesis